MEVVLSTKILFSNNTQINKFVLYFSIGYSVLLNVFVPNNHPDEVDSKAVLSAIIYLY